MWRGEATGATLEFRAATTVYTVTLDLAAGGGTLASSIVDGWGTRSPMSYGSPRLSDVSQSGDWGLKRARLHKGRLRV